MIPPLDVNENCVPKRQEVERDRGSGVAGGLVTEDAGDGNWGGGRGTRKDNKTLRLETGISSEGSSSVREARCVG